MLQQLCNITSLVLLSYCFPLSLRILLVDSKLWYAVTVLIQLSFLFFYCDIVKWVCASYRKTETCRCYCSGMGSFAFMRSLKRWTKRMLCGLHCINVCAAEGGACEDLQIWRTAKEEFLLWILLFLAYVWKCCSFHLSRAWCERLCSSSREQVTSPLTQTDMGAVQVLLGQGFQNEEESSSGKAAWVAMQLLCLESSCLLCGELPSSSPSLFANEVKESVLPSVTDLKTANYWKITALTIRAKTLTR